MTLTSAATDAWTASWPAVEVGTVAEILEEVVPLDEVGHADPLGSLVAHTREAGDVADAILVHEERHRVAADACTDEGPVRNLGAAVVGAAGAEERRSAGLADQRNALPLHPFGDESIADAAPEDMAKTGPSGRRLRGARGWG